MEPRPVAAKWCPGGPVAFEKHHRDLLQGAVMEQMGQASYPLPQFCEVSSMLTYFIKCGEGHFLKKDQKLQCPKGKDRPHIRTQKKIHRLYKTKRQTTD